MVRMKVRRSAIVEDQIEEEKEAHIHPSSPRLFATVSKPISPPTTPFKISCNTSLNCPFSWKFLGSNSGTPPFPSPTRPKATSREL